MSDLDNSVEQESIDQGESPEEDDSETTSAEGKKYSREELEKMKIPDLKTILKGLNYRISGPKADLIERILNGDTKKKRKRKKDDDDEDDEEKEKAPRKKRGEGNAKKKAKK
eukprot:TRINITY_DN1177_c0_g1_i4.p1 TRINITY_DN1177_c0_g1~~TRINITY_DN1177_c0_g1_i4.p1  ORF type:complete len:112 (+),score=32.10 TRINITY_DN1177_c0_g1_i4:157-492(+)